MTDVAKLIGGSILAAIILGGIMFYFQVPTTQLFSILFPAGVELTLIVSLASAFLSGLLMSIFYSGEEPSKRSTGYFFVQPTIEELIYRVSFLIIAHALGFGIFEIVLLGVVQAAVFAITHPIGFLRNFLLASVWFAGLNIAGIIPASIGHTTANLAYQYMAKE